MYASDIFSDISAWLAQRRKIKSDVVRPESPEPAKSVVELNQFQHKDTFAALDWFGELFIRLLPDGKPLAELIRREDGVRLRFIPEFTIDATGRYASESFPQRPDIVIEIDDGEASQLFIFDPKYKLDSELSAESDPWGRPKKEDIDKMHAYRDAIRDASENRVVAFASILYPGPTQNFGRGIAALKALPGEGDEMRANVSKIFTTALMAP